MSRNENHYTTPRYSPLVNFYCHGLTRVAIILILKVIIIFGSCIDACQWYFNTIHALSTKLWGHLKEFKTFDAHHVLPSHELPVTGRVRVPNKGPATMEVVSRQ